MSTNPPRTLIFALFAAMGASACCVGPLLLLSLGIGGAWIGQLTSMAPYSPYLTAVTLILLVLAFRQLYRRPITCAEGRACANPGVMRKQRIIFWGVTVMIIGLVGFPYYADYIFD